MNAKELHDLYAPLWAKVPETQPRPDYPIPVYGLEYQHPDDELGIDEGWYWRDNGGWLVVPPMDTRCAAALCRVAVEDWLTDAARWKIGELPPQDGTPVDVVGKPCLTLGEHQSGDTAYCVRIEAWAYIAADEKWFSGPTRHHALVAAALAVAGAAP